MSPVRNIELRQETDPYGDMLGYQSFNSVNTRRSRVTALIEMELPPAFLQAPAAVQADRIAGEIHQYYMQHAQATAPAPDPNAHYDFFRDWEKLERDQAPEPEGPIARLDREVREVQEASK